MSRSWIQVNTRRPDARLRRMGRWSRSTARKASKSAGRRRGRRKASTTRSRIRPRELRDRASAAERHRRPAPRPRAPAVARRHDRPDAPDAGLQRALPAGLRPRRHLDAERGREAARQRRASRGRTSAARRSSSSLWEWLREYGGKIMFQFRRIGASLDYRRERFTMDEAYVRAVMRFFVHLWDRGLDLPREPDHQLVPVPPDVALRPRARARGRRRRAHVRPLPVRRRRGRRHDRDRAPGDDPRGRRRRRAPGRPALPRRGRPRGGRAVRRAARAGDRATSASSPTSARAR